MPAKRVHRRRRDDPQALAKVWCGILETGFDFFDEAAALGIRTDDAGQPDVDQARAAWAKYGPVVMANRDPQGRPPWALEMFGEAGNV